MTITDKVDFKAKVRASMCQLQNDPEKIRTKNYRSNMPPDSAFTYGLINSLFSSVPALLSTALNNETVVSGIRSLASDSCRAASKPEPCHTEIIRVFDRLVGAID